MCHKSKRVNLPSDHFQSTLLYGAETWTVYRRHVKNLPAFMMRHLRSIMKMRWEDKVTNIKVLKSSLRYKDTIKRNLKKRDINTNPYKSLGLQRDVWRDTVK